MSRVIPAAQQEGDSISAMVPESRQCQPEKPRPPCWGKPCSSCRVASEPLLHRDRPMHSVMSPDSEMELENKTHGLQITKPLC